MNRNQSANPNNRLPAAFFILTLLLSMPLTAARAQEGIAEEQRRERQELQDMRNELSDIKSTINDAMDQFNQMTNNLNRQRIKEIHLIARQGDVSLTSEMRASCFTYNGKIPGPEVKVKQGEIVRIVLHNQLPVATSLHIHGMILPAGLDALPKFGQGLVKPGETYAYQFAAQHPGTFWYHPHVMQQDQQSRGMFGAIVVEPSQNNAAPDKDVVVFLSDLLLARKGPAGKVESHGGATKTVKGEQAPRKDGGMVEKTEPGAKSVQPPPQTKSAQPAELPPASREAIALSGHAGGRAVEHIFLLNGKSAPSIAPIDVGRGQRVRLRLINAGRAPVPLHLAGHRLEIMSINGGDMLEPHVFRDTITLNPADRVDAEFSADNPGDWILSSQSIDQSTKDGKFPGGIACIVRYAGVGGEP